MYGGASQTTSACAKRGRFFWWKCGGVRSCIVLPSHRNPESKAQNASALVRNAESQKVPDMGPGTWVLIGCLYLQEWTRRDGVPSSVMERSVQSIDPLTSSVQMMGTWK